MNSDEASLGSLIHQDLPLAQLRQRIVQGITEYEATFRRQYPWFWLLGVAGPFVITAAVLIVITVGWGWSLAWDYILNAIAAFFLLGRFSILAGGAAEGTFLEGHVLSPTQLFGMITFNDLMVALFVTFNMGILFRIPVVGPKIADLTCDSKFIMEQQPWIRKVAWLSTVALVIFPAASTGSVGGSIFGRLLGLDRIRTLLAVFVGSIIGNWIMYYFSKELGDLLDGPMRFVITALGIGFIVLAVMAIEWRYRKAKARYIAEYEQRHEIAGRNRNADSLQDE